MILVTGATGNVGREVVNLLLEDGEKVAAVTRNPGTAVLPADVEVVEGDPSRPDTLASSLRGVTGMFLNPRAVGDAAVELLALAREQGVKRVVAMSALNVDFDLVRQPSRIRGEYNKEVEAAAVGSGLEWVGLRSGYYAVNTIGTWADQIRAGDVVRGPYSESTWAPLHERDLAAVGARALLTDDLVGRRPVLTGPKSLTQEVPPEVAKQGMIQAGFPEALADGFLAMQAESYGQPGLVSGEVEKILGRPAQTYAEWAAEHVADFGGPAGTESNGS